nr:MAG TPA: hypothetical protein [Caudoviricetes sp.]
MHIITRINTYVNGKRAYLYVFFVLDKNTINKK